MKPNLLRGVGAISLFAVLCLVNVPAAPRLSVCGYHWLTGRLCPLCGLTRGLFSLAKGDWRAALAFNALTPLGMVMLYSLFWHGRWRGAIWKAGAAVFAVYAVVRVFRPEL